MIDSMWTCIETDEEGNSSAIVGSIKFSSSITSQHAFSFLACAFFVGPLKLLLDLLQYLNIQLGVSTASSVKHPCSFV